MSVQSLGQEDALEKEMATHSSILAWKSYGQRSLAGYSPWGHKKSDTTEATQHDHYKGSIHFQPTVQNLGPSKFWKTSVLLYNSLM